MYDYRREVRLVLGAILLNACTSDPTAVPRTDSVILGEWRYASVPTVNDPPSLNSGLHVTIVIESLEATQFRGRVALWFAGDVGLHPDAFGPVTGTLDDAGAVTMRIPVTAPGASDITIVGSVAGDVLTVRESSIGPNPGPFPSGGCFERGRS